jgi:uncharacterized protein involved in outer membrane biogenesis
VSLNKRSKISCFVIAGICLVVFLATALFVFTFDINTYKPRIETALSQATGMEVHIGKLGLVIFPKTGISARDIVLQGDSGRTASAKEVRLQVDLLPLLQRRVLVRSVEVVSPELLVTHSKEGSRNSEVGRTEASGSSGMAAIQLQRLRVSGGHFGYMDKETGRQADATGCAGEIRDLSANVSDFLHTASFAGEISCEEIKTKGVNASAVRAVVKAGGGRYEANPVTVGIYGGEGRGSIAADLKGKVPSWSLNFSLAGFRFEKVLAAFGKGGDMQGQLDLKADLTVKGEGGEEMKRTARGEITLRGQDLVFRKFDLDRLLEKYEKSQKFNLIDIGGFFLAGPLSSLLTKGYEFGGIYAASRGGKSTIRRLVSDWRVDDGVAEAKDVAFVTDRNRVAMKGGLDFVGDRFRDVTVAVLNRKGCAVYSQKIRGSFGKPVIDKPSVISSLLKPMMSLLEQPVKLLGGERCEVFYRGSLPQPGK